MINMLIFLKCKVILVTSVCVSQKSDEHYFILPTIISTPHKILLCLHESSNPGSTHFRSQTEFQSTNGCGLSQSRVGHWRRIWVEFWLELSCERGL